MRSDGTTLSNPKKSCANLYDHIILCSHTEGLTHLYDPKHGPLDVAERSKACALSRPLPRKLARLGAARCDEDLIRQRADTCDPRSAWLLRGRRLCNSCVICEHFCDSDSPPRLCESIQVYAICAIRLHPVQSYTYLYSPVPF